MRKRLYTWLYHRYADQMAYHAGQAAAYRLGNLEKHHFHMAKSHMAMSKMAKYSEKVRGL